MMTIDDAIKILLEEADKQDKLIQMAIRFEDQEWYRHLIEFYTDNAFNYRQMAEWLTEFKELRSIVDACNILAVDAFAVEKLCKELKEAKILLKSAVENAQRVDVNGDVYYDWIRADEALKLIGDEDNV